MIFNLILPLLIITFFSFLSPYIYMVIPVYDTQTCWNYFNAQESVGNIPHTPCWMQVFNSFAFIVLNWLEIVGYAYAFWLVRNIRNELNIKREIQAILFFWTAFSITYFLLNLQLSIQDPGSLQDRITYKKLIYATLILRNFSTLCATTLISIFTMYRRPQQIYLKNPENEMQALEFDLVLKS